MQNISQMNKRLNELNSVFSDSTSDFLHKINLHETRFTSKDAADFECLISKIKNQVKHQITQFFNDKFKDHSQNYQDQIQRYKENAEQLHFQLFSFRTQMQKETINLKHQQHRKQVLIDHFSQKFYYIALMKKHLYALKKNVEQTKQQNSVFQKADALYRKNLVKKVFFPWRSLSYKQGYENTVAGQTQKDIQNIHMQYSSIINILKAKIRQTDEEIKIKKAAKGQFTYALSKNLMKTISNLSLEVMSLNQMSLNDGEYGKSNEDEKLMAQIDNIIQEKLKKVNQYKESLLGDGNDTEKHRKIRFV